MTGGHGRTGGTGEPVARENRWRRRQEDKVKELRKVAWDILHMLGTVFFNLQRMLFHREELATHLVTRILIIKLGAIGDVLQTTPLLRAVRKSFPDAKIVWLAQPWTKEVLEANPHLDEVVCFEAQGPDRRQSWRAAGRLAKQLKGERFHLALIPHRTPLAGLLAWRSRIPYRVGFDFEGNGFSLTHKVSYEGEKPEVERNLDLLRPLGIPPDGLQMDFVVSKEQESMASAFLLQNGVSATDEAIAIGPGGGDNPVIHMHQKRWPISSMAELAERITKSYAVKVVLVGGSEDVAVGDEMMGMMSTMPVVAVGKTNLRQLAALLTRCRLYIGNDSGPLYVAAAVGIPTIGLYGPTDPALLKPEGPQHIAVSKGIDCSPCFGPLEVYESKVEKCPVNHCMRQITVDEVWEAVVAQMAAQPVDAETP